MPTDANLIRANQLFTIDCPHVETAAETVVRQVFCPKCVAIAFDEVLAEYKLSLLSAGPFYTDEGGTVCGPADDPSAYLELDEQDIVELLNFHRDGRDAAVSEAAERVRFKARTIGIFRLYSDGQADDASNILAASARDTNSKLGIKCDHQGRREYYCDECSDEARTSRTVAEEREAWQPLREAMQEFVDRCDRGEVLSKYTYAKFKELLRVRGEASDGG